MKKIITFLILTFGMSLHTNAQFSLLGTYGTGTGINFYFPSGVKSLNDKIYIADDLNNRVVVLNTLGGIVFTFGGTGSGNGQFSRAWGIDVDQQNQQIYVSDYINNRIQVFDIDGNYLRQFGSAGNGNSQFRGPQGIFLTNDGKIFVVDQSNNNSLTSRIEILSITGDYLNSIYYGASSGNFDHLTYPSDVDIDKNGNIYVADNQAYRVQIFDKNLNFITKFGSPGSANGQFNSPSGIVVDNNGKIFVTDYSNSRIQVFENNGAYINSFGTADLNKPYGIDLDGHGNIYITDFNNNVYKFGYPQISLKSNYNSSVIDFGSIQKGQTTGPKYLSLYNTGQASFSVTGISYPPGVSGFDISNHIYPPNPLSANYYVYLDPTVTGVGDYLGVITITSQGMGNYFIDVKASITDLSNGLVAYYPFNGDARDYSGNGYDLSISSSQYGTGYGPTAVADKNGNPVSAYSFNGTTDKMDTKSAVNFGGTTTVGFSLWVYSNVGSSTYFVYQGEFGISSTPSTANFTMIAGATNTASATIPSNQWTHLAGNYDGQYIKIYVNGTLSGSVLQPGKSFNSNYIKIGYNGSSYWNGNLDEIAFYDRVLTDGEIQALYHGQAPVTIPKPTSVNLQNGVVAYYPFNGDAKDQTINGYDLSVSGASLINDKNSNPASAYSFNGSTDKMNSISTPTFGNTTTMGFSLWFNSSGLTGSYFFYQGQFGLFTQPTNAGLAVNVGSTNSAHGNTTASQWTHLAGYYDGQYIKIFVNGTISGTTYWPGASFSTGKFQFGYINSSYWAGSLDEVVFYNRTLTDNEIAALYSGQTVNVKPISSFSVSGPLCQNTPIAFSDISTVSPTSRTWQFQGGNITTSQQNTPLVTYASSGIYPVTITSSNVFGSGTSLIKNITVNGLPLVNGGNAISICKGSTVTLAGTGALTYTWSGGVMNNQPFVPLVSAIYSVAGMNVFGCTNTSSVGITFKPVTTITSQLANQSVCGGNLGSFTVSASGTNLTYLWNTGSAVATIVTSLSGSYMVTVNGTCGTSISNTASLVPLPLTTILTQPINQSVCGGNLVSFAISASGANLSYLWSDGSISPAFNTSTAGIYQVTVSGACGTIASNPASLSLNPLTQIISQPLNTTVCGENMVSFSISATGTNLSFLWNNGITNTSFITTVAGNYTVTISGQCGNVISSVAKLTISPIITVTSPPVDGSICYILSTVSGTITGVNQNNNEYNMIKAYPNPTSGIIIIEYDNGNAPYNISNELGETIQSGIIIPGRNIIDLNEYSVGLYILNIKGKRFKILKN